jgi:hypothetical protein
MNIMLKRRIGDSSFFDFGNNASVSFFTAIGGRLLPGLFGVLFHLLKRKKSPFDYS